ncbi:MAG: spermidine/putrescine ABC transporter substrate-binding protein [Firmicutes bacterium]|nr:spermidine/putrescine ABC transporter substrate-binding protein [Bacillota bacterium]
MMNFTTNEDMLVKLRNSPQSFDVVFPSDYAIERMISEGLLAELNYGNIPNFQNIDENLTDPDYDPGSVYSVPYMWGTVGILYNSAMVSEPVTSWSSLFDPQYQKNVLMLDSPRDSIGLALKYLGYSMNTRNPLELNEAKDLLIRQKKDGIVKAYQVDEMKDKMAAGEAAFAVMWSGDAQYAIELNEDLQYVVPIEGSNIWVDGMVIPKAAKNKENAEAFINFLCRPDIAQMNCEEIWYSSPNTEAVALMGEEYTENPTLNPPAETVARCEVLLDIQDFIEVYNTIWLEIKSAPSN